MKHTTGQGGVAWFRGLPRPSIVCLALGFIVAGASWLQGAPAPPKFVVPPLPAVPGATALPMPEGAAAPPKLTGIVQAEAGTLALFELTEPTRGVVLTPALRVGERAGAFELIEVNRTNGSAVLHSPTGKELLQVYTNQPPADRTINLHQARLDQVLDLYQMLANQTVIRPPQLTLFRIDLQSEAGLSSAQAAQRLEQVFSDNGLIVEHRGNFVFVVPSEKINSLLSVPNPPEATTYAQKSPALEVFPPGLIKFQETDLIQVLDFLAELSDKNLLSTRALPPGRVTIRSQTAMNRLQAVWMMTAALRLGEIATVPAGKDFMFVVPPERVKTLPTYDEKTLTAKAAAKVGLSQLRFVNASLKDLLGFYAEMIGRQALPIPAEIPQMRISFQGRKPMAQPDCIFALESLAALNNVRFQFVGEKEVGVIADR